ncbi:MAG: pyruvate kinase [Saprospiraceae bacterium]
MPQGDKTFLINELEKINAAMLQAENDFTTLLQRVDSAQKTSAINLLDYLVLRNRDIRELQDTLHANGLSSLASSESHIRSQLLAILGHLHAPVEDDEAPCTYATGKQLIKEKTIALFGNRLHEGIPHIMVTFDRAFGDHYATVKNLLQSGMTVARINCAHDDESVWMRMIRNIRKAEEKTGLSCKIYMDLAGPKIRTDLAGKKKLKISTGSSISLCEAKNSDLPSHSIGITLAGIIPQLQPGERVLFDDGVIEALVSEVQDNKANLLITRISSKKPQIKSAKGINFPDSNLTITSLTEFDRTCLPFIKKYADLIGYSYLRNAQDVIELQEAIQDHPDLSVILKIETPDAVKHLPEILFQGMQQPHFGVMIARGDLAVEIGFERMSEIQEEILWICEAGHVPVIYATQILESLNKAGLATRSEVIDAAHAAMAECVMINKGDHTIEVIETLRDILLRSGGHHVKKRYTFRPLQIASRFVGG